MTIAACHVSPEGVVLGTDSTTTLVKGNPQEVCHFDHAQKIFEVGPSGSSVALATWGTGDIDGKSHRLIAHTLGSAIHSKSLTTMETIANELAEIVWNRFSSAFKNEIDLAKRKKASEAEGAAPLPNDQAEIADRLVENLSGGYCIAGRGSSEDECKAYEIGWSLLYSKADIREVPQEQPIFWGVPYFMERLVYGIDSPMLDAILQSGNWKGTEAELFDLAASNQLLNPSHLPIRFFNDTAPA